MREPKIQTYLKLSFQYFFSPKDWKDTEAFYRLIDSKDLAVAQISARELVFAFDRFIRA